MDVLASVLRVLVPPFRDFLPYDCAVLPGWYTTYSMGQKVQTYRKTYQEGLRVSHRAEPFMRIIFR